MVMGWIWTGMVLLALGAAVLTGQTGALTGCRTGGSGLCDPAGARPCRGAVPLERGGKGA